MYTVYTGERVKLRPFKDEKEYLDLEQKLSIEPNFFWGAWWKPLQNRKKDFKPGGMLDANGEYSTFAVESLATGELVGYEEYGAPNPGCLYAWLGTFILPEHWHHGYGIEAKQLCLCFLYENFPIVKVSAETLDIHHRAANGLARSGMTYIGKVNKFFVRAGVLHDLVCYVIFREEWEQQPFRQIVKRSTG